MDVGGRVPNPVERYATLGEKARKDLLDDLGRRAAAGDQRALEDLLGVLDQHRVMAGAIRNLIIDDADADDVAQDVLITVATKIHTWRGESRLTTWLFTVARNCAIGHLRRKRPELNLTEEEAYSPTHRVSSMIASRQDLSHAFEAIPDKYRAVVILRDVEGHSYADIAEATGLEPGTVRSRIARGRAMIAGNVQR